MCIFKVLVYIKYERHGVSSHEQTRLLVQKLTQAIN